MQKNLYSMFPLYIQYILSIHSIHYISIVFQIYPLYQLRIHFIYPFVNDNVYVTHPLYWYYICGHFYYVPDFHFVSKTNSNVIPHKWIADNKAVFFICYYVYIKHISYINGCYSYYLILYCNVTIPYLGNQ